MSPAPDKDDSIHVAAAVICRHGLLLAAQRPDDKPWAGFWELPGGKAEANESPEEALRRELAEELGIKARDFNLIGVVRHKYKETSLPVTLHFFQVGAFDGEPSARENQNLRWIGPEDLAELDFLPPDREILSRVFPAPESS